MPLARATETRRAPLDMLDERLDWAARGGCGRRGHDDDDDGSADDKRAAQKAQKKAEEGGQEAGKKYCEEEEEKGSGGAGSGRQSMTPRGDGLGRPPTSGGQWDNRTGAARGGPGRGRLHHRRDGKRVLMHFRGDARASSSSVLPVAFSPER